MKNLLAKIWVPLLLTLVVATQSSGIDAGRAAGLKRLADSLILTQLQDSTTVRDTISTQDSLHYTDTLKFRYYIELRDTAVRTQVRDSLIASGDSLGLVLFDSLYVQDSLDRVKAEYDAWYASLSRKERRKEDANKALPGLIAAANRKAEIKDSIKTRRDSVKEARLRVLETFAIPDSLHFKRIITWKHERDFNNLVGVRDMDPDTSYRRSFNDYLFFNEDINASWLGVSGSPVQLYDWFKREEEDNAIFYTPYSVWSYSAESLPQYNTKTPYTELAYYGTLFANKETEEANVRVLTTQNISPQMNLTIDFRRFGGNGLLKREDTSNKTFAAYTNYVGKKYLMHAGFIYNKVARSENGGVINEAWVRDTIVDAREIDVYLRDASNELKKKTLFLDQTYRIPFTFLKNLGKKGQADSTSVAQVDTAAVDMNGIDTDVMTAFIGHSSEYSLFSKAYTDRISDAAGREFYGDRFYINPNTSTDSLRVMRLDNKVFIRLQPWKDDGIVSKLDVGIGDKLVNYYSFSPVDYIQGPDNVIQNSVYLYAGANGQYRKYMTWGAKGKYNFLGHEINDFNVEADMAFHFYPFRRAKTSPLTVSARFETSLKEPDWYQQHLYTNHYRWDNDFSKISTTKAEASLSIPRWDLAASFGYGLLTGNIYYDNQGMARQNTAPMSVMTAALEKNFVIWKFHLDHQAMLQLSSNEEVLPLPLVALNFRYYIQLDVVPKVMQMQIGANGTYTTKWYAPAYNPVLGVFHNQNESEYGNCPYVDAFVNIQWKKASIFIKWVNVNMGWPNKSADYFSAAGYIAPQRAFKFGITWPFWVRPGKGTSSGKSSTSAGGGRNSSGGIGSMSGAGAGRGLKTASAR